MMPSLSISQTPRLKASTITSPMLVPFVHQSIKRTQSVIDQDYDLMGLSRHNGDNDESQPINLENSMAQLDDDLNVDFVKKEGPKMPFNEGLDAEFNV